MLLFSRELGVKSLLLFVDGVVWFALCSGSSCACHDSSLLDRKLRGGCPFIHLARLTGCRGHGEPGGCSPALELLLQRGDRAHR